MKDNIRFFVISLLFLCKSSFVLLDPQFGNFEIYQVDLHDRQSHNVPYQGNPFLSYQSANNENQLHQDQLFTQNQPEISPAQSNCDNYWSYQNEFDGKYGKITIPNPHYKNNVIRLMLSVATRLSSRYVGEISLAKDKQLVVNDIANGLPILYRVRFPIQNPVPKVTAIYYNDQLLCTGPKDVGQFVTTITLDHTFYTGLSNPPQRPVYTTSPPTPSWMLYQNTRKPVPVIRPEEVPATRKPPTPIIQTHHGDFDIDECGVPDYKTPTTTGLVVGGMNVNRGQFPWMAAYYHNGAGSSGFICGGSLISTKLIVTAAHCIQYKKDPVLKKAEEASFYIGKHNLDSLNFEKHFIMSGVSEFIIHPDWDYTDDRYDADIAIAVLYRTISFTKFVKPICLWTNSNSHSDIVGQKGIVAGWGKTEFDAISTSTPKWAEIPVVDLLSCIRSNDAFNQLTSDRTFCAGNRVEGVGPCQGDSGGGLVVKNGNKWYLRGIVSSALYDPVKLSCDTKNYAVFTDSAKFTDWMQKNMQKYG